MNKIIALHNLVLGSIAVHIGVDKGEPIAIIAGSLAMLYGMLVIILRD